MVVDRREGRGGGIGVLRFGHVSPSFVNERMLQALLSDAKQELACSMGTWVRLEGSIPRGLQLAPFSQLAPIFQPSPATPGKGGVR